MRCIYVFLDESGNFDFGPKGTPYFVLCGLLTFDPMGSSSPLQELRYTLLSEGLDIECFHASEDIQSVRNRAIESIRELPDIYLHTVYLEKKKTPAKYQFPPAIYALCGSALLRYILKTWNYNEYDRIIIVFDRALAKKDQEAFLKSVKPTLKGIGKRYYIYFHRTMADFNGQIADYAAWAKYISLTRGENRPLNELGGIPRTEIALFGEDDYH
jgi:hypothetical protein